MRTLYSPEEGIAEQSIETGILLLRRSGEYVLLNHTGAYIWKQVKDQAPLEALLDGLASMPNAPDRETCRKYLQDYLKDLVHSGFLKESE